MTLWDACGNRLLVVVESASDEELTERSHAARRCFDGDERIADGIAWFAPRDGFFRTAFFNPDGSRELLCGNSLLVAAAALGSGSPAEVRPLCHPSVEVHAAGDRVRASARVPRDQVQQGDLAVGRLFDTGSLHLVIHRPDVKSLDLPAIARPLVEEMNVNVTVYSAEGAGVRVRTFERGVNAETLACGTGALAVGLACEREVDVRYPGGRYRVSAVVEQGEVRWSFETSAEAVRRVDAEAIVSPRRRRAAGSRGR